MTGTKRLVIILISAMLAAYAPISQKGAVCEASAAKTFAGEKDSAGVDETEQQAEYKLSIKKEGKKLTLKKDAEAEIVQMVEKELEVASPCNCMMPLHQLESYEKNGVVIEVKYPNGREMPVKTNYPYSTELQIVNTIMVMASESQGDFINYNSEIGSRGLTKEFYEKILSCLTSENIISEEPLDFTAPKTNIKNGKTYKSGKKITFSDEGSGMKSAKLDGKKIKNGHVVKKKGKHKLVLTDKAGNKKTVRFKIK